MGFLMYLQLGVADHAVAQSIKQSARTCTGAIPGVGTFHIDREAGAVGEGVQLQEIELPLQV